MDTDNKAYRVWMEQLNTKAETTRYTYARWVNGFMAKYDIADHERLYLVKMEDLKSEDSRDRLRIEGMAKTWMHELVKQGFKPRTVQHVAKSLRNFYDSQNLPFTIRPGDMPRGESVGRRLILKDQIAKVYDSVGAEAKLRNRALIMIAKDSGLRISDIGALTVESYRAASTTTNENGEPFKAFDPVLIKKCKVYAYVHLGPESIKEVDAYLAERGTMESDAPLFVDRDGKKMSTPALSEQFRRLCRHVKGAKMLGAHSFRKYHLTQLESAGMPLNWVKELEGKGLDASTGVYSHPKETGDLLKHYMKFYDSLRLFGEGEVIQLRKEVEETKRNQNSEVENMKVTLANQQAVIGELMAAILELKKSGHSE